MMEEMTAMPAEPAASQVEKLLGSSELLPLEAFAELEHRFGVLPLAEAFFDGLDPRRGALGLFTITPDLTWEAAAVAGERSGDGLVLSGEVRVAGPNPDGVIVLVRLDGPEHRLAWVEQATTGGQPDGWLRLDGFAAGRISKPVTPGPGSEFFRCIETYAGAWALAAAIQAGHQVRALRRAARTTQHQGKPFASSQWVSLDITEVEIEAELTLAAARRGGGGLAVAAAAARTLHAIASRAVELRDEAGLKIEGDPQETARALTAFLGGPLLIESELGHALGIERFA